MPASTRLETKSLKMVFGARARFARISWVNWLELVASVLNPSASRAFSACAAWTSCCMSAARSAAARCFHLGQLKLIGQLLLLGLGELVASGELHPVAVQRGGQLRLLLRLGLRRRELLSLRLRGSVLQLAVQIFNVGLRGGKLLLQPLVFLFALGSIAPAAGWRRARAVASCCCNCSRLLALLSERLFHHGGQVVAGVRDGDSSRPPPWSAAGVFSSAIRLMSVENVSRLNSRKSQMTMRMLRFMTATGVGAAAGRKLGGCGFALPLRATISGAPGADGKF